MKPTDHTLTKELIAGMRESRRRFAAIFPDAPAEQCGAAAVEWLTGAMEAASCLVVNDGGVTAQRLQRIVVGAFKSLEGKAPGGAPDATGGGACAPQIINPNGAC